jgi:hypothetical protein
LQRHHYQAGDVNPVSHGEVAIALEGPHEEQEERLVHYELAEEPQALLLAHELGLLPLQDDVVVVRREEDIHGVGSVVQEGDAATREVARQVRHLGLELGEGLLALGGDAQLEDVHLLLHVLEHAVALGRLAPVGYEEGDEDDYQDDYGRYDADERGRR